MERVFQNGGMSQPVSQGDKETARETGSQPDKERHTRRQADRQNE